MAHAEVAFPQQMKNPQARGIRESPEERVRGPKIMPRRWLRKSRWQQAGYGWLRTRRCYFVYVALSCLRGDSAADEDMSDEAPEGSIVSENIVETSPLVGAITKQFS